MNFNIATTGKHHRKLPGIPVHFILNPKAMQLDSMCSQYIPVYAS